MNSNIGVWSEAGLLLFMFFVVVPAIAALIGYAAWRGKPKNFDRQMYWTAFAATTGASLFLMVFAQRMQADVRTWQYPVQLSCFGLGAVLFGVAGGCIIGVFTYRRGAMTTDEAREEIISGIDYAAYHQTDFSLHDSDKNRLIGSEHYSSGRPVYDPSPWAEANFVEKMAMLLVLANPSRSLIVLGQLSAS